MYRIGIDVGGTFTDFTLIDERDGTVHFHKVPSTPSDPSEAIAGGIADLMRTYAIQPGDIGQIGHGTTVATNLVIERKGACTGLITTKGFRDVLEIGRQTRPHLYDYSVTKAPAMVAREFRAEVPERIDARGNTLIELDRGAAREAVMRLKAGGVESVAICFLHSYRDPTHEQAVKALVEELLPDAYVSVSSEVLPEFREFERMSTTVVNAAVGPRMQRYLDRFVGRVRELGVEIEPFTVHSNGGLMSIGTVRAFPVRTCLSGPAAGVVGAAEIGRAAGFPNLVTFDVGGTSTDVSLIHDGAPLFTSSAEVAGYPVKTPMIDIHVIGAGGGSIAWMDDAGSLKVGPHSAGAVPGPVAYARGGTEPTITDAELALSRLNPVALLKGRMPVDAEAARRVIAERVAAPLELSLEDAAQGIIDIANANMSRAIRSVSTERGYDLAGFALFAYGGAGPLHAADVAEECGIPVVIVPQEPGTLCARGILLSDVSFDFVRSEIALLDAETWRRVCRIVDELRHEADTWLARERVVPGDRSFRSFIEARYEGQNFEVVVPMEAVAEGALDAFAEKFHTVHKREYGYDVRDRAIEIVNCRLQGVGRLVKPPHRAPESAGDLASARTGERRVYHGKRHGWVATPVYDRSRLASRMMLEGPAVIEEMSSTTVLAPGHAASVDALGNLVIRLEHESSFRTAQPSYPVSPSPVAGEGRMRAALRLDPGLRRDDGFDPIAMEVFSNRLLSITEDMNNTLVRSSFSTNIKERRDCSVALFDGAGRLVAQGTQIPLHLGSLAGGVDAVLRDVPIASMREGDVFISNDPYLANGTHLPDINIITPVFWEGELVAFAANTGHHSDVGGVVPGSIAGGSRSIFEEGIRIPVARIANAGEVAADLLRLIVSNTRDPVERELDLRVQIATNTRGADAVHGLIRRLGLDAVRSAMRDVIAYTRKRIGNRIAELADGEHSFTSYLDDDGMGGDPVPIKVTIRVTAGRLHFDFAGSGTQARGAINVPINALNACVYYAVKALLDPELPPNAGLFDPITIDAPKGTIVNPNPPAACGARSITCQKIAGAIFGAFRDVLPRDRIMASSNDACPAIVFSGPLSKRAGQYVYMETLGGGSGARFDRDGMNGVHVHMTNTSNLPAEALENEYPLLVDEYALVDDSGGAGRTRGGLGIARQIRALVPGTIFSARSDSHTVGVAAGVLGGADGRRARLVRNPACPDEEVLFSKVARLELKPGEAIRIETPGGGGCGRPEERPDAARQRDVRDGYVTDTSLRGTP